jgi:hypothetical protein
VVSGQHWLGTTLWEQQQLCSHNLLDNKKKASSITHGHHTLVRTAAHNLLDNQKKASSITHGHTLVRTAAHKLLDNQRKLHQSHMVIIPLWEQQLTICWTIKESFCQSITYDSNVHKQLLVKSSSALLVHSQVLVMCTAGNIRISN